MTDGTGTTLYEFDAAGRQVGMVYPHEGAVRYAWDGKGRATEVRITPAPGEPELITQYDYDEAGDLVSITDPTGGTTQYSYDQVNRSTVRVLPNGIATTYTYDERDRVIALTHRTSVGDVLQAVTYERNVSGEPTRITREDGSYVLLTYDDALRLDTESYYDGNGVLADTIDYDYDLDGNRVSKNSLSGGFETYGYSAGFRLDSVSGPSGARNFAYDAGGRSITVTRPDGVVRALEYDSDDRITRVLEDGSEMSRHEYDGMGRRVASHDAAGSRRYLVAPAAGAGFESPQAVVDAAGGLLEAYVYSGNQPIMRIGPSGNVEYLLHDGLGTVTGVADQDEALVGSTAYDAFGLVRGQTGSGVTSAIVGGGFGLHGLWLDHSTQTYHARARTYDPQTGRFTSRDPMPGETSDPATFHPYVFANSNPHVFVDPSGLTTATGTLVELEISGAIYGILASMAVAVAGQAILQDLLRRHQPFDDEWVDDDASPRSAPRREEEQGPRPSQDIWYDPRDTRQDIWLAYLLPAYHDIAKRGPVSDQVAEIHLLAADDKGTSDKYASNNIWSPRGMRVELVAPWPVLYPPEIDKSGLAKGGVYPNGSYRRCHFHDALGSDGRSKNAHLFFGPPKRKPTNGCMAYY